MEQVTYLHVQFLVPWAYRGSLGLTAAVIRTMRLVRRFSGVLLSHMGAAYFAAHRAPRTHLAPDVTRQVSARITSDGGWIPRPVARTSSPRVHGSGFVVCRTRARWDRAHQGYVGHTRGRTRTSITRSRAPSLRSERAVAPANPGELCSFTASRAPDQTTSSCPVCVPRHVLQVRKR